MGITLEQDGPNVGVMRISGKLVKAELDGMHAAAAKKMESDTQVKLMIVLDNFQGWAPDPNWGDLDFYAAHGDKITRIAVVGDLKHKDDLMMFLGAGFRKAPVKYFPPEQLSQARQWLSEV